ncbi:MAG: hypothetical protein VXY75_01435 [Bacteroidota bacterium]|nr:hypothetical protein [Bacteroidota bacterium]MEC8830154.1 hypothetical protein [Bacteroidota bacterium]
MVDKFIKAYRDNDMESTKNIFSKDAVYSVNDSDLSVSELVKAFSSGHTYFEDISHTDVYTATVLQRREYLHQCLVQLEYRC